MRYTARAEVSTRKIPGDREKNVNPASPRCGVGPLSDPKGWRGDRPTNRTDEKEVEKSYFFLVLVPIIGLVSLQVVFRGSKDLKDGAADRRI